MGLYKTRRGLEVANRYLGMGLLFMIPLRVLGRVIRWLLSGTRVKGEQSLIETP